MTYGADSASKPRGENDANEAVHVRQDPNPQPQPSERSEQGHTYASAYMKAVYK